METLWQDIRYGVRMLLRNPSFSLVSVALVAVGVGASTAVFSIFNAFLIRPLPYEKPDRLSLLYQCARSGETSRVSHPNYLDWRQQAGSFDALACCLIRTEAWRITDTEPSIECVTGNISSSFFQVLRATPALGRLFTEEDEQPSAAYIAVISDSFRQRHFGTDEQVIGKTIFWLGRIPCTIVGVLPASFRYPAYAEPPVDVWAPVALRESDQWLRVRDNHVFHVLGRLKAGVSVPRAQAEMDVIAGRLAAEYPSDNRDDPGIRVQRLQDHMAGGRQKAIVVLMGAVAFVFLVACTNLAGLLFARGITRERELAVRAALGAARWRLVRQMATENLLLAGAGGGLGGLGAVGGLNLLMHTDLVASMMLPEGFFRLDTRVLGFALAVSVLGVPLVSLLPSICHAGLEGTRVIASGGRSVIGSRGRNAAYMGLVGAEVSLTIILLVAAGLMIRSLMNVVSADPGFRPENVLTMDLYLDHGRHQELLDQVQAIPGVEKAALTYPVLGGWRNYFCVEGQAVPSPEQAPTAEYRRVTTDYFAVMGIRLLQGRLFNEWDRADSQPVAIVDETLAKRYWPEGDAVGKHLQPGDRPDSSAPWLEIVGVVGNTRNAGVEADAQMQIYWQVFQHAARPSTSIVLRASADPAVVMSAVKEVARQFDWRPHAVRVLDQIIGGPSLVRRLISLLLAVFAGIALFLSTIGIYAVTRYSVSRRIQEFGVRVALGATRRDVLVLVLRRALAPVVAGAALGLVGTVAASRALSSLLFELSPWDPLTYAGGSFLLLGVALLACYLPARRAARIDPMMALRYE